MKSPVSHHKPVLLKEVFKILDPQPGEFFIDGTLGLAGHTKTALERINPGGLLLGIDRDSRSAREAERVLVKHREEKKIEDTEILIVVANFTEIPEILSAYDISQKPDCLLLDLGFSSRQIFSGKGFSYDRDEPLIMRYDGDTSGLTAARVVNEYDRKKISGILREYGEERFSERIADGIVNKRKEKPLRTTRELAEAVKSALPRSYSFKVRPEARTFFALRNFINNETEDLKKIMDFIPDITAEGSRVAVITFNSLEDKIVKNAFKKLSKNGARLLTKKPIIPSREEVDKNRRARSAKLRAIKII